MNVGDYITSKSYASKGKGCILSISEIAGNKTYTVFFESSKDVLSLNENDIVKIKDPKRGDFLGQLLQRASGRDDAYGGFHRRDVDGRGTFGSRHRQRHFPPDLRGRKVSEAAEAIAGARLSGTPTFSTAPWPLA